MSDSHHLRLCAVAAFFIPGALFGQGRDLEGARPIRVRVHVTTASITGDTTTLGYTVDNLRTGDEDLVAFLVTATAPVIRMPTPARRRWFTDPRYADRAIALWNVYRSPLLRPGETTPELVLVARGVPDFARYWAEPNPAVHPVDIDDDPDRDDTFIFSDTGTTVGLLPIPSAGTPAALATRLRALAARARGPMQWISNAGVCHSLDVKLSHAQQALASGARPVARTELDAFVHELDAQHGGQPGKHVSDEAYALLRPNATYLLGRL